jgi:hypothetical protein
MGNFCEMPDLPRSALSRTLLIVAHRLQSSLGTNMELGTIESQKPISIRWNIAVWPDEFERQLAPLGSKTVLPLQEFVKLHT